MGDRTAVPGSGNGLGPWKIYDGFRKELIEGEPVLLSLSTIGEAPTHTAALTHGWLPLPAHLNINTFRIGTHHENQFVPERHQQIIYPAFFFQCHLPVESVHVSQFMGVSSWDSVHGTQLMGVSSWESVHGSQLVTEAGRFAALLPESVCEI